MSCKSSAIINLEKDPESKLEYLNLKRVESSSWKPEIQFCIEDYNNRNLYDSASERDILEPNFIAETEFDYFFVYSFETHSDYPHIVYRYSKGQMKFLEMYDFPMKK